MGAKPTSSRKKSGDIAPRSKGQPRRKPKKQRPNSILLADLFLWINVVDECLYHPAGDFDRAAVTEGYGSFGNVVQRIKVLEDRFGPLFQPHKLSPRNRSGAPTKRGAALAKIFMPMELLFHWASTLEKSGSFEVRKLKELILSFRGRRPGCSGPGRSGSQQDLAEPGLAQSAEQDRTTKPAQAHVRAARSRSIAAQAAAFVHLRAVT
jgi:hypothetical protein